MSKKNIELETPNQLAGSIIAINNEIAEVKLEKTGEILYIPLFLLEEIK